MAEATVRVVRSTTHSAALFERALGVLVDGVSSPSRGASSYRPYPLFMDHGVGSRIVDVDENEYVDLMLAYGALIHGHAHPRLVAALSEAATKGALFATASEVEVEVAETILDMVPGVERVRFANTGTEAAMAALRIVRGFTGKTKFIKFEGHYHGWSDSFSVSSNPAPAELFGHRHDPIPIADSSGLARGALEDVIVVPWNEPELVEAALLAHPGEVAAIVTEPVMANIGVIPPKPGFLQELRRLADQHEVLLYIDETVSGFRFARGGAQEYFDVQADIVSFGKALGAGFPVAAVAGRADVMEVLARGQVLHFGTQNANPLLLSVVRESLAMLNADDGAAFAHLGALGTRLAEGLQALCLEVGVPAVVQSVGPMLQVFFLLDGHEDVSAIWDVRDFSNHVDRGRFSRFAHALFDDGVYLSPAAGLHSVVSTVHTEGDVDQVLSAAEIVLRNIQ